MYELTKNQRQSKDPTYAQILNRIRTGKHTTLDINILQSRLVHEHTDNLTLNMLHIYPLKKQRDEHNKSIIDDLSVHF